MTMTDKIRRLLAKGLTPSEVAKKLGVRNARVHTVKWLDKKNKKKPTKIVTAVKEMKTALDFLEKERADEARTTALHKKPTKLFVQPKHLKPALKLLNEEFSPNVTTRQFTKEEIEALDKDWVELPKDHVVGTDLVNKPPHYTTGGIDFLDYAEAKGLTENAYLFNVVKYVSRAGKKVGVDPLEDLKKAEFYLKREIAVRERA
jgi:transcriptional regulator